MGLSLEAVELGQVESKECCSSSELLSISGPPSLWIRSLNKHSTTPLFREGVWFSSRMNSSAEQPKLPPFSAGRTEPGLV